jgi:hypothetical protein
MMKESLLLHDHDDDGSNSNRSQEDMMKTITTQKGRITAASHCDSHVTKALDELQRRLPYCQHVVAQFRRIPPRWRCLFVVFWVLWKFVVLFLVAYIIGQTSGEFRNNNSNSGSTGNSGSIINLSSPNSNSQSQPLKILYIVTSLAEFDNGNRATTKGKDRLGHVLLPVLVDSVESIVFDATQNYQVDVYLILAYSLSEERQAMIRERLPANVGLQIWDDSCPTGYDRKSAHPDQITDNTRALARQHRYVVKDKLPYYDLFMAWEDDMRITGQHVQQFMSMSHQLDLLRAQVPLDEAAAAADVPENMDPKHMKFFGSMTRQQLDRLVPGFVRVEVLLNETENGAQTASGPIPLDYKFSVTTTNVDTITQEEERHFDPKPCCQVQMSPNDETPSHPDRQDVVIWETSIKALSLRQLPQPSVQPPGSSSSSSLLDWVVLLPGPGKRLPKNQLMGGYWSGRDGAFGHEEKPSPGMPDLIAQQGGWMATREQIMRLHTGLCQGAFVPPFDEPIYRRDGQESMNVEFYSGGYQFFTGVLGGCNMQRIVSMHPDHFSKHFIYHVANNKQRQLASKRFVRADHLLGQLNTVKKTAEKLKASQM